MADARIEIGNFLDKKFSGEVDNHPFWVFEPWDVDKRAQQILNTAKLDGVDLYDPELIQHAGVDPHPFQSGYLLSTAKFRTLLAASRVGKTYPSFIELGIMVSGEKPLSLRFPKGHDTKVRRPITPDNIRRFGRYDSSTGTFLDFDATVPLPKGWDEWNCGNITGAGEYPDEKICPEGGVIWIGTTHKALWEFWWPRFSDTKLCLFPKEFLNKRAGFDGFTKSEWTVHCVRDIRATIISYESDPRSFEAIETHACVFDEESPQKECVTAAINHTKYFSMVMTPYNGITYTKKLIFNDEKDVNNNVVFHATSYDSPYLTNEMIKHRRSLMEPYEIGARIWGLHTETKGQPYYDRHKLNAWIRRFKAKFTLGRFIPSEEYDGVVTKIGRVLKGLMSIKVGLHDDEVKENDQDVWKIYEKRSNNYAYYLMADSAEGSDIPGEAGDVLASLVMRPPDPKKNEKFPQIVASLRSTMKTANFARVCSYALRYYNNALLCAEGPTRGSYNALFFAELREYPYWFLQTTLRDSTRKLRSTKGFDTNAATRHALFDCISEVLDEYQDTDRPEIRDEALLIELAGCIVNKIRGTNRPDHTSSSTLDTTICYGQGIFIWRHYANQIKNRAPLEEQGELGFVEKYMQRHKEEGKPVFLGEKVDKLR